MAWCLLLTIGFLCVTTFVFNKTDKLKCSVDGEHFIFEMKVLTLKDGTVRQLNQCYTSSFVYFLYSLATIQCPNVFHIAFRRSIKNIALDYRLIKNNLNVDNDLSDKDIDEANNESMEGDRPNIGVQDYIKTECALIKEP